MSDEGDGNKGLREEEGRVCGERRRVENESVGVGQSFLDNEVSKGNLNGHDIKIGNEGVIWASAPGQVLPQQPSQGASVCWERFLNVRSLRVLLVENDDSTRHVVSALLRNCSYEVIEASNGIRAWKILEDITTHVDLVLTEVIMPCLSGIGLLCKIMSHKTRNIPVIMMSSHDSMGLVFKCLSKGAVDFLVKPIRKNELKNLWQHVWRRCHSSSGSGSESGTQTHKYVRSKNADESDNSTSNGEEDNQSPLNFGDGSDHGSGAQSSWTKQAVDDQVDSSGLVSLVHGIAECPDSTCAQVIHPNAVPSVDKFMNVDECLEQKELLGNAEVDNEIDISPPKNLVPQLKVENVEVLAELTSMNQDTGPKIDASEANDHTFPMIFETNGSKELPFIEQSLKRPRGVQEVGKPVQDDRNVLRRSQSSAFSRYNATMHNNKTSDPRSPSHLENGLDGKSELVHNNIQSHSGSNSPTQFSSGGNFYKDMTTTSYGGFGFNEALVLRNMSTGSPSAFQSVKDDLLSPNQKSISMLENAGEEPKTQVHHQFPLRSMKPQPFPSPQSVSSNIAPVEGDAGNSINGSASGSSNHGTDRQNGCSTAANAGGLYNESVNGRDKSGSGDASGTGSGNRVDQCKHAQREAALTKFREKRKERCFKGKVRYQSRKRLAEQRPRVRGQFARPPPS